MRAARRKPLLAVCIHAKQCSEAYTAAMALLKAIRGVMARLGRQTEFAQYIASVRKTHKLKGNFIKLLDHAKWT